MKNNDLFDGIRELGKDISRMGDELSETFSSIFDVPTSSTTSFQEEKNHYRLIKDLPGVRPEDLELEVVGTRLQITFQRVDRPNKKYQGSFVLPDIQVNASTCQATLKHGILTVTVPKPQTTERQKIKVVAE